LDGGLCGRAECGCECNEDEGDRAHRRLH
jgi:hypothetical protein